MKCRLGIIAVGMSLAIAAAASPASAQGKPPSEVVVINAAPIPVSVPAPPKPVTVIGTASLNSIVAGSACQVVGMTSLAGLPDGVTIELKRADVSFSFATPADNPHADLRIAIKTADGTAHQRVAIPVTTSDAWGFAGGSVALDGYVLKRLPFADVGAGEAYSVSFCLNRGGAAADAASATVSLVGTIQ